eukprot:TRINITY_DN17733_c2_g2_i1.p2 TRINITY_DN17733_c2_g2~~TRINITY_DN17733_c2_g2_i1.p2  ORF type:complete len:190 (-),score=-13.48 TRINITY_DN17733_c2_g2_i1:20-589(-)
MPQAWILVQCQIKNLNQTSLNYANVMGTINVNSTVYGSVIMIIYLFLLCNNTYLPQAKMKGAKCKIQNVRFFGNTISFLKIKNNKFPKSCHKLFIKLYLRMKTWQKLFSKNFCLALIVILFIILIFALKFIICTFLISNFPYNRQSVQIFGFAVYAAQLLAKISYIKYFIYINYKIILQNDRSNRIINA